MIGRGPAGVPTWNGTHASSSEPWCRHLRRAEAVHLRLREAALRRAGGDRGGVGVLGQGLRRARVSGRLRGDPHDVAGALPPGGGRGRAGTGRAGRTPVDAVRERTPGAGRAGAGGDRAGRPEPHLLPEQRHRGDRDGAAGGAAAHGPHRDRRVAAGVPRSYQHGHGGDRARLVAGASEHGHGNHARALAVPVPRPVRRDQRRGAGRDLRPRPDRGH